MARVYVTQFFTRGDFSEAEKWGDVVFMTNKEHFAEPTHEHANRPVYTDLVRAMGEYVPGSDYLLVAPSQVINLLVGALMLPGQHNVLKWDNRDMTYRLHKVHI